MSNSTSNLATLAATLLSLIAMPLARASIGIGPGRAIDEVLEWNAIMIDASLAENTPPFVLTRSAAIVQSAVFDSLNGIERRYQSIYVSRAAPLGASGRAAVVQAAYGTLVQLFPSQRQTLDTRRWAALERIANSAHCNPCYPIELGTAWGQQVADEILAQRSSDGFSVHNPPYLGSVQVGKWRPTPPAFAPGVGVVFATMTPWILSSHSQFRLGGPRALSSREYAADFLEIKSMGSAHSTVRTADQTLAAQFWAPNTVTYFWDRVATSLATERNSSLLENARVFAQLNLAMADALIACWDSKYTYSAWRPVTAIQLADTDGNPATISEKDWTPLIVTPPHPEYPSAHSTVSAAAAKVLASYFGENTRFAVDSSFLPTVKRTFKSFAAALDEIADARVFGGIHFRTSCNEGRGLGNRAAEYVLMHSCRALH